MPSKYYDWDRLKADWLQSDLTLNQFRISKGISECGFYQRVKKDKWKDSKKRVDMKILKKIETKISNQLVDEWEGQRELWKSVEKQASRILKRMEKRPDDKLSAGELNVLADALEKALKGRKIIAGQIMPQATDGAITYNTIINIMDKLDKKDPSVVIPEAILGEAVKPAELPQKPEEQQNQQEGP